MSVCPSVCLSVRNVPVSDENGLTYRHSFFSLYGSAIILVLPASNISQNSDGATPFGGAKDMCVIKNSQFSTNKSLYLANSTRYRHSYYGRRIGTRMRSIKWCHLVWKTRMAWLPDENGDRRKFVKVFDAGKTRVIGLPYDKLDAGMWRYHANRMDARRSQFDLGRVDAYI